METTYVQVKNELAKPEHKSEFNEAKWDNMFGKYMQVLDTDYKNYIIVYTCQENAEITDQHGTEMNPEDVFKASINQREYYKGAEPESLYLRENF